MPRGDESARLGRPLGSGSPGRRTVRRVRGAAAGTRGRGPGRRVGAALGITGTGTSGCAHRARRVRASRRRAVVVRSSSRHAARVGWPRCRGRCARAGARRGRRTPTRPAVRPGVAGRGSSICAGLETFEAGDDVEDRRLAASARPDDGHELAGFEVEGDAVDDGCRPPGPVREGVVEVADVNDRPVSCRRVRRRWSVDGHHDPSNWLRAASSWGTAGDRAVAGSKAAGSSSSWA